MTARRLRRGDGPLDGRHRRRRARRGAVPASWRPAASRAARCPTFPGLERFRGDWYHTGHWPHEGVDFTGKRVGVIGTGSSGDPVDPDDRRSRPAHLTVFQRTPNFSVPARNAPLDPEYEREMKARLRGAPAARRASRRSASPSAPQPAVRRSDVADEERAARVRGALGRRGGFGLPRRLHRPRSRTARPTTRPPSSSARKIREIVHDPAVAELLSPHGLPARHASGSASTPSYYETFNRDNVTLVDVRETPIEEITPTGLRTTDGEYELDMHRLRHRLRRDDRRAARASTSAAAAARRCARSGRTGPRTYLGLAIAGFPNLFMITGPGSPSVLTNMIVSIEQHVDWIADCIALPARARPRRDRGDREAEDDWVEHVNEVAERHALSRWRNSWYLGANIPGKPRVFMPYVGGVGAYRQKCDEVAAKGYEGFALTA